jgi:hypothetical protein
VHGCRRLGTDQETTRDREQVSLLMSSILIQYATASPILVDSVETPSKARRSIPKGGSASAVAAASGDGDPRCSFFEGGEALVAARARLTIVVKKSDIIHVIARG